MPFYIIKLWIILIQVVWNSQLLHYPLLLNAFFQLLLFFQIDGPWQTIYLAASTMEKINEGSPLRTYFRHILCGRRCNQVYLYFFIK